MIPIAIGLIGIREHEAVVDRVVNVVVIVIVQRQHLLGLRRLEIERPVAARQREHTPDDSQHG
ncbi:MAG: hypothetical protein H0T79_10035 [Deltaproteobacteria bacterium]|nr:hypothetical protein [Deltaproteobacteria bacterium]